MSRQRGNFTVQFALLLLALVGVLALVVDVGHFWQVRGQLQHAADAAALAGVRDLDGTAARFVDARLSAQTYGARHDADARALALDLNGANAADGDVVLGHWDFKTRTFTIADGGYPPRKVTAVKVNARRTAAEGGAVATLFARVLGHDAQDLTASAIAVGGTPSSACGFPLAVPACALVDAANALRCDARLTFGQATTDNVGFTLLSLDNPNTPDIYRAMQQALSAGGCIDTSMIDEIRVSNGNNLNKPAVDLINAAVAAAGADGLFVDVPVLDTGDLSNAQCGSVQFNRTWPIAGYVKLKILGATNSPNRAVLTSIDCTHTSAATAGGGGFFGMPSTSVYLVQ